MKYRSNIAVALLSASTLALSAPAFAQSGGDGDEIIVTGIRSSLAAAADLKRKSNQISDAVVAEDIGKLPDNNIAEALQRITGVSINTDFGVGDSVSIRGLSQNRVELNGRSTAGDSRGGVSLQDFPSSFLKSVEVIKSPTADMIEGALGGTVRMETIRPLDLRKPLIAGSLDFEYADKTEEWAPIISGTVGNVWDLDNGGRFGVIGSLAYQDRTLRQDEFFSKVTIVPAATNVNGLTSPTVTGNYTLRNENTVEQYVEERERTAANLSFQYEPASERGNFYLDLNRTERAGSQEGSSILDVSGTGTVTYGPTATVDGGGQISNYTLNDAFVIPKAWSEFRETVGYTYALGGEWDFTDRLNVSGEFSTASSESTSPKTQFNLRPIDRALWNAWAPTCGAFPCSQPGSVQHYINADVNQTDGDKIPGIIYSDPLALTNPDTMAVRSFEYVKDVTTTDEDALRFDVTYENPFDLNYISAVNAGVRFSDNEHELNRTELKIKDIHKKAYNADGTPFTVWIDDFETLFPNTFETRNYSNSFDQTGISGGQNDLLTYRVFRGDLLKDAAGTYDLFQQLLATKTDASGNPLTPATGSLSDNETVNSGAFRNIQEKTTAFYLSADLDFGAVTGNVGGRFIETDLDSTLSGGVKGSNSYTDFLPSLNLSYDLYDDMVVRVAAAKVMRRPNYGELSPAFDVNGNFTTATRGAVDLEPYRATQYDLSIERYFGEGGLVSAAVFYKDVESFLTDSTVCEAAAGTAVAHAAVLTTDADQICRLTAAGVDNTAVSYLSFPNPSDTPAIQAATDAANLADINANLTGVTTNKKVNGRAGSVSGFEFGYQQSLSFLPGLLSNLGVNANYTYANSEQPNGSPLLGISENTFNTQVYWENEKLQARLAYNYRDQFLDVEAFKRVLAIGGTAGGYSADPTLGNSYREERGQWDASAAYNINEQFTVVGSITNLTGTPSQYTTELGSPWKYTEADRRLSVGIRGKF